MRETLCHPEGYIKEIECEKVLNMNVVSTDDDGELFVTDFGRIVVDLKSDMTGVHDSCPLKVNNADDRTPAHFVVCTECTLSLFELTNGAVTI